MFAGLIRRRPWADDSTQAPSPFCNALRHSPESIWWLGEGEHRAQWRRACRLLPALRASTPAFHYSCNQGKQSNAGDSMLPLAARLAFEYFLGAPQWHLREVREPTTAAGLAEVNKLGVAVLVGGGGLLYPNNAVSRQTISGWQWVVSEPHLRSFEAPLFLSGVGWNGFRGDGVQAWPSSGQRAAFDRSLVALLSPAAAPRLVGLRETYSLDAIRQISGALVDRELLPSGAPAERITYQPCATTLLRSIDPRLSGRKRLGLGLGLTRALGGEGVNDRRSRVLSVNVAFDHPEARFGSAADVNSVMDDLVEWCHRAHQAGWEIHMTMQMTGDTLLLE